MHKEAERIYLNDCWRFCDAFDPAMVSEQTALGTEVRIPHTVQETPYNYFDASIYQKVSGYQKTFVAEKLWENKRVYLVFEGVAHEAEVYLNGKQIGTHANGYTAFEMEVTSLLDFQKENLITVRVDSNESLNIPPFGHVIDYMTYGGIYRDVYLEIRNEQFIEDAFVYTESVLENPKIHTRLEINHFVTGMSVDASLVKWGEDEGEACKLGSFTLSDKESVLCMTVQDNMPEQNVALWSIEEPNLYELKMQLKKDNEVVDTKRVRFGFREAVFKEDGFYLNGKKTKIRGCNRHQSYAYVGYAMPKSMQRLDAEICKRELKVNAVRTSHYPQSQYFIDRCDELGLLVFTEIPGWQHIGDQEWKRQACQNVEEMVRQYRNHPSIILWGVRINESLDDESFYTQTNEIAHRLDPSRQTSGVRYLEKSQLLEDVYAFNDFSHTGDNLGAKAKKDVTSDVKKGFLVSEYNGHMYPTKTFDDEKHRVEHVVRHARVLDQITAYEDVAGSFTWCMFDYNTHKDFGSGDRICYHGIMDMFRNPKQAAYVYATQQEQDNICQVASTMDIGEYAGGFLGDVYVLTNADSVRLYKNDKFIKEFTKENTPFPHLPHGPILIDDFIGNQLLEEEELSEKQARAVKKLLLAVGKYGMSNLPLSAKLGAAKLLLGGMKFEDGVKFYNKYLGNWGSDVTTYRFEAVKDGKVVKTIQKGPVEKLQLQALPNTTTLLEEHSYDVAEVRLLAKDQNENLAHFYQEPLKITTTGAIELIGPDVISLKGGMGGIYVKSRGVTGTGSLLIEGNQFESITIEFNVTC